MRDHFDRLMYRLQNIMLSNIFYKFVTIFIAMCWIILVVSKCRGMCSLMRVLLELVRADCLNAVQGACIIKAVEAMSGVEPDTWRSALFTAYSLIANAPGADAVGNVQGIHIITNNIIFFFGIFTFAIVLGIITSTIQEQVDYLLQATHRVIERDHTVILNWSERMIPVLRQIAMTRHYRALPVVIMADRDVDEMRTLVQEGLEGLRLPVAIRLCDLCLSV